MVSYKKTFTAILFALTAAGVNQFAFAQQAIIPVEVNDDVLPISSVRFDDAVEPPKENFTSTSHKDMWEQYEHGELDQQAFVMLQDEYNAMASKDPKTRDAWLKRQMAMQKMLAKKNAKNDKSKLAKNGKSTKDGKRDIASEKKAVGKKSVGNKVDAKKPASKSAVKTPKTAKKTAEAKRMPASVSKKAVKPKAEAKINPDALKDDFKQVN
jgi:hypothetical protein